MFLDPTIFGTVFTVIFVAELPDKTALASLVLATRYKALPVFAGSALALTIQSVVAIAAGGLLSFLPARAVHIGTGVLFLVSALFMLRRKQEDPKKGSGTKESEAAPTFLRAFGSSFGVVFIAEWGDLTQLGTAALAARYRNPATVFCAATLALWLVTGIAVLIGNRAGALMKPELTKKIAAFVFVVIGIALLAGVL